MEGAGLLNGLLILEGLATGARQTSDRLKSPQRLHRRVRTGAVGFDTGRFSLPRCDREASKFSVHPTTDGLAVLLETDRLSV
ncbi:hypothetical protein NG799_26470 [Laspinema sp. D1]|uniref:Uncharacterized protein n=1 Tax=Laspinema palackyanum D2a TaxID=2953684 RepID=A0ABT2MYN1_9CYAN|nr:hypothetical protein [Laspinema sp. D2a]